MAIAKGHERFSVDVPKAQVVALREAYVDDGIRVASRVRLLVDLWSRDEQLQAAVQQRAADLRRAE